MAPRYDVRNVPPQGGYVAKQCPVRAQNDTIVPTERVPTPPTLERRFQRGRQFEASILVELRAAHADTVVIHGHGADAEASTLAAMQQGAPLILNARLPTDEVGRRLGRPDILLRAAAGGYRAVDVKHHMSVTEMPTRPPAFATLLSPMASPTLESARTHGDVTPQRSEHDVLQLAHYQRMLEAVGMAATDGRWGGIIGTERLVVWYDLDAPAWRTPSVSERVKMRSTIERYDFEFDFRIDIIAVAQQHQANPAVDLLVLPVKTSECDSCPWWGHCSVELSEGWGDVSLLPRVGYPEWRAHRDHGVTNREQLANLDPCTAQLIAAGLDLAALIDLPNNIPADTQLPSIPDLPEDTVERLNALGLQTFGDIRALDPRTLAYADTPMSTLPSQIDLARANLGPAPVYRRRGVEQLTVPRADVEIDVDMENVEDGCYLWGCLLTDRRPGAPSHPQFHSFVTWDPIDASTEAANTNRCWRWLMDTRDVALAGGYTFCAYCYHASAENQYLFRMARACGIEAEVEAFTRSDEWVDLLKVWNDQLITGGSSSLKSTAPIAGFRWPVDEPGGAISMLKYDLAAGSDPSSALEARDWLIAYNRGDTEATRTIRLWMDTNAQLIPSVADIGLDSLAPH